jgi:hypothetical protein
MNPKKLQKSRYSTNIPKGNYDTMSNNYTIVGHKSNSVSERGYIYLPYIPMTVDTWDDISLDTLMGDMKEKIKRLKRNIKINNLLDDR